MNNFLNKIPVSPTTSFGSPSIPNGYTIGTNFSILQTGGFMEVYTLSGLTYTIPVGSSGLVEYSGNTIPIQFLKGSGSAFSPDVLTLNSDNISSGRRKLGMLVYVYETKKIYQYSIDNYDTLWNNATGATGPGGSTVVISNFGSTVKNNSPEGIALIDAWTASTISGVDGYDDTNASWRVLQTGGNGGGTSITGGTFDHGTETLSLYDSTGGTITITGFTDVNVTGGTYSAGTITFTNNTGGTFNVGGLFTGQTDNYITGGTFNKNTETLSLYDLTGGTVTITGFTDNYTTGFTFNQGNYDLSIKRNNLLPDLTVNLGILSSDVTITGGTYDPQTGTATFTNNSGGTFNVTGFLTGYTDFYVTGGTFDKQTETLTLTRTDGGQVSVSGFTDVFVTGGTYSAGTTTFTNNSGGTFDVTGFYEPNYKIILKKIELGARYINDPNSVTNNLASVLINRLTDGILLSNNNNIIGNYAGVKIDYFITYDNPDTSIRTKELYVTQTIDVNLDPGTAFSNMCNYIYDNYGARNVNFYCEMYLELNSNYSAPTQVRLTNTLFNSLNPYKYSRSRNYMGEFEFVRSNYNLPIPLNSIESDFIYGWQNYYNPNTSEDIIKKVFDIVSTSQFYGSLSGQSQTSIIPILYSDGSIDTSFVYGGGFDNNVNTITVQIDGKILIGGNFNNYNGTGANYIIRLNTNGSVDTSFVYGSGFDNKVYTIAIQSDGKILVGGVFNNYDVTGANSIIRLNTNGSVDTSFVYGSGFDDEVYTIEIQSNGKILIGGIFSDYNGTSTEKIIRLNSGGTVDTSFVYGSGFDGEVNTIVVQTDGKILIGGNFNNYNGTGANYIIRLNTNGSVDTSFVYGSGFDSSVKSISVQSDGKILVGGFFSDYQSNGAGFANSIIRLNTNGSVDTSFVYGSGFDSRVYTTKIQSDNKILVGGEFNNYDGTGASKIIRLNTNGSVDTSFVYGSGFDAPVITITIQSDNKILLGGNFGTYTGIECKFIIRLNIDFTTIREIIKNSVFVETLTSFYSKFRIPVNEHGFYQACDRLYNNFYGDLLYDIVSGSTSTISSQASIDGTNSTSFYQMIDTYRLYPGGTPGVIYYNGEGDDTNINLNSLSYSMGINNQLKYIGHRLNSYIQVLPYYQDVYILKLSVVGEIGNKKVYEFLESLVNNYLSINDSSLKNSLIDNLFNEYWLHENGVNTGIYYLNNEEIFNNNPYGPYLVIQSTDEKMYQLSQNPTYTSSTILNIYAGGDYTSYDGNSSNAIIKLDNVGDIFWSQPTGFNFQVLSIAIQSDGKILVGGDFTDYNGTGANRIIRLNPDGSVDGTFVYGDGFNNRVSTIVVQSDGKILVGGDFTDYQSNGVGFANYIIRLNSDGSIDGTFAYGDGFESDVYTIAIQSDGKILVGGKFTDYDGTTANYIIRLNTNGSVDTSFVYGSGFDDTVTTIAIQSDGKILVGGSFTDYQSNGVGFANNIIRLNTNGSVDTSFVYGDGFNQAVITIAIQSDGKILIGGKFTDYQSNGTGFANFIIRLNTNGSVDTSFVYGDGFDATVNTIAIQPNGKILVGGGFTDYQSNAVGFANSIIRLNSDGSVDGTFGYGGGFNQSVYTIVTQTYNESINVDAIYKGTSFKPSLYPLNLNQLTFEVPITSENNQFYMGGEKQLRFIVKYTKLQKYDIITTDIKITNIRGPFDNKFFTLTLQDENFEDIIYSNISNGKRKQLRPGSVEIYLSFLNKNTSETSILPNYKIIVAKYGDNEVFKLIKGISVSNNISP